MTKRVLSMAAGTALAVSFVACGSDSKSPTATATPTPTPPTTAQITFTLDPPLVIANNEGGGQYTFKVNLAFQETAGVGFTITTIHQTSSTTEGTVMSDETYVSGHHVAGYGAYVRQSTVRFHTSGEPVPLVTKFVASFTDDGGHALTATTQVNVLRHGEPKRLR